MCGEKGGKCSYKGRLKPSFNSPSTREHFYQRLPMLHGKLYFVCFLSPLRAEHLLYMPLYVPKLVQCLPLSRYLINIIEWKSYVVKDVRCGGKKNCACSIHSESKGCILNWGVPRPGLCLRKITWGQTCDMAKCLGGVITYFAVLARDVSSWDSTCIAYLCAHFTS